MKPYYEKHGVTLYNGNALQVLQELEAESVDALITDPPYSSGGFTRGDRAADPVVKYQQTSVLNSRHSFSGDNRDGRSWAYWCTLWLGEALRVVRPAGYALMFTDWRQLPLATDSLQSGGFLWRGIAAWDKGLAARAPHTGYFRHQAEYVVWGTKGPAAKAHGRGPFPGVYQVPVKQSDKFHLTGKPTELMAHLVKVVAPGGSVLDPFAGSGTTLLAAAMQGRSAIGAELDERNCEIAAGRLDRAYQPIAA